MTNLTEEQYRVLLIFRTALRHYLRWSSDQSQSLGLTPQQHQLLLAVRGHPGEKPPSITEIADYLLVKHHSAVELATRVEQAGLVNRSVDPDDQRVVRVTLTPRGREIIESLSEAHMSELERVAAQLDLSQSLLESLSRQFSDSLKTHVYGDLDRGII